MFLNPQPKSEKKAKKTKNYINRFKKGSFASLERMADSMWSKRVLKRDGNRCRIIDASGDRCRRIATEAHHVMRRWYRATRWNKDNGIGICQFHHRADVDNLKNNTIRTIGKNEIDRLKKLAYTGVAPKTATDMEEIIKELRSK